MWPIFENSVATGPNLKGVQSKIECLDTTGSDQACKAIQGFAAKPFAFDGQPAALVVIKTGLLAQQFLQHSNLILEIFR